MIIDSIEVIKLELPMKYPYEVAYQSFDKAENVLIRISAGGFNGWGCAAPDPHVTGEYPADVLEKARSILPSFIGKDPFRKAVIMSHLKKEAAGAFSLWAAVDMALWDLLGKKADLPVWKILGGYRERIRTSATIGICSLEDTIKSLKELQQAGFFIVKLKGGQNVHEDLERLKAVRMTSGDHFRIRFDANQGYSSAEAIYFIENSLDLNIELFEQPNSVANPELLGVMTRKSITPIMADESILSLLDAFHLVKKGLIDLMNIKIMKVGGITEAIQVDAVARSAGVEVMVGCMDESALGIAAGLHFALSRKNIRYADLDGHFGLKDDPAAGAVVYKKGYLYPAKGPGLGWAGL
ncbi:MAG: dipeptide epimerase [Spirochaetales bacterium]|nr:dipeptide epimerase [Spirochaetales bacterium]